MNVTPIVYEYVIICEFINCKRRKNSNSNSNQISNFLLVANNVILSLTLCHFLMSFVSHVLHLPVGNMFISHSDDDHVANQT